jgi:hypothetical protein
MYASITPNCKIGTEKERCINNKRANPGIYTRTITQNITSAIAK